MADDVLQMDQDSLPEADLLCTLFETGGGDVIGWVFWGTKIYIGMNSWELKGVRYFEAIPIKVLRTKYKSKFQCALFLNACFGPKPYP